MTIRNYSIYGLSRGPRMVVLKDTGGAMDRGISGYV